jgi:YceI-like domain
METVGCQSCSSPPSWRSPWEAVRHRPRRGERGTAAASPVVATALGDFREAESSGVAPSVGDEFRTGTITTGMAGQSSCSRTSMIPTTATTRIIPTTRTMRTATRIHLTTLLNTASGTVRRTWRCSLTRVQREKHLWLAIAVAFAAPGLCSSARASALELDPAATRIAFSVKNLSGAYVAGTFRLASGRVVLDDGDLSRSTIEAVIDAGSVDTDEPKRDAHLRSGDFLDVIRYPTIAFRSTRIEPADGDHWR